MPRPAQNNILLVRIRCVPEIPSASTHFRSLEYGCDPFMEETRENFSTAEQFSMKLPLWFQTFKPSLNLRVTVNVSS